MGIGDIWEIGKQGLATNRQALQTTANNIANASTPGYSRQRAVFESRAQTHNGGALSGGGVDVKKVIRIHDAFVQSRLLDETVAAGRTNAIASGASAVEDVISTAGTHLSEQVNGFFNAVRQMSMNPELPASRAIVANSADSLAKGFHDISKSLETLHQAQDVQLESYVTDANDLGKELGSLNENIRLLAASGEPANELKDRRDGVVTQLSNLLGLQRSTDDKGNINLVLPGVGPFVTSGEARELGVLRTPKVDTKRAGSLDIFLKDHFGEHRISLASSGAASLGGTVGGLIHVRDELITPALESLDHVAHKIVETVNSVHREGFGADGVGGRDLFKDGGQVDGAAGRIALSDAVTSSHSAIAAAAQKGAAGDNQVALKLADLEHAPVLAGLPGKVEAASGTSAGKLSFGDSLAKIAGDVGIEARRANEEKDHHESILAQLENHRQAVSGVSLEEEAANMMQFQNVFNAAAKTLKVGNELFQTLLTLKT